jgi:hypothetical protein
LQRVCDTAREILAGHFIIDAVAAVVDGAAKLPFRFGSGETERHLPALSLLPRDNARHG